MVKTHALKMACFAQVALLLGACSGDDASSASATDTATTSGSTSTSGSTTASETTGTSTSTSTTTGGSTTAPETTGTTGTTTGGNADVDAFRFTEMFVRDPHFFIVPVIGCEDITDKDLVIVDSINKQFNQAIVMDTDDPPDGTLNMSFMLLFRPLDQAGPGGTFDFATGDCTAPIETTSCDVKMGTDPATTKYNNVADMCLTPEPGELSPADYNPKPGATSGPCFSGEPLSFTLDLGDFQLPFVDAEISGKYVGDPADGMVEGVIHGFLTEEDANNTTLPADIPLLGGSPIAKLLPGGDMCCAKHDDRDMHMGISGWWFYIDFKAARVAYTGQ